MYVIIPPPRLFLSVLIGMKFCIFGVLWCFCNFVSCMVKMSALCFSDVCSSSVFLFWIPFMFIWMMLRCCGLCFVWGSGLVCWWVGCLWCGLDRSMCVCSLFVLWLHILCVASVPCWCCSVCLFGFSG